MRPDFSSDLLALRTRTLLVTEPARCGRRTNAVGRQETCGYCDVTVVSSSHGGWMRAVSSWQICGKPNEWGTNGETPQKMMQTCVVGNEGTLPSDYTVCGSIPHWFTGLRLRVEEVLRVSGLVSVNSVSGGGCSPLGADFAMQQQWWAGRRQPRLAQASSLFSSPIASHRT